ncbi:MAG TPA: protein kinase [Actinomycetota bacterium]
MTRVVPRQRLADRYVVETHVADGGMASVWRARDEVLARTVAVKTLREEFAGRPDFRERFRREAVAAARLTHPGIINIFDTGVDDGVAFIVMEYFDGPTLAEVMASRGPMDATSAISVILPVLDALAYAHAHGIVHRDVKPANILVGDGGRVKVTDFGIAKALAGADLTTTGKVLGTVRYLSPEQVRGDEVEGRSDLYSAGVVLYELVTGRVPFQAETDIATAMMRLTTDPPPPRSIVPGLPRPVEAAILRALSRRPEDRFPTAESMRGALERWAPADQFRTEAASPAERAEPRAGGSTFRSWMLIPLLLLIVAGAAVGAGLAVGRLKVGGPFGLRGAKPGAASKAIAIAIQRLQDFDPLGDGSENPSMLPLMTDGNDATAWSTDHYTSAAFGGLKSGLGVFLGLGGTHEVNEVRIVSPIPGWRFELLPGSSPDQSASPLQATDGSTTFQVPGSGRATIHLRPARIPGLMIWITQLAPGAQGFRAEIAEVSVSGPGQ